MKHTAAFEMYKKYREKETDNLLRIICNTLDAQSSAFIGISKKIEKLIDRVHEINKKIRFIKQPEE